VIDTRTLPVGDESDCFVKICRAITLSSIAPNIDDHNPLVFGLEIYV
jgi:hypothetical protein